MRPPRSCPTCGAIPRPAAQFCATCGVQLPQQGTATTSTVATMPHNAGPARRSARQRWQRIWRFGLLLFLMSGVGVGFTAWYRQPATEPAPQAVVAASTTVPRPVSATRPPSTRVQLAPQPSRVLGADLGRLAVHVIDVGQGDSILIHAPDGTTALIDGGYDNGQALAYLRDQAIQRIDLLIASHPHADHIGGLVEVLRALPVGAIWTSGATHTTGTFEAFLDAIAETKTPYYEAHRGDRIPFGTMAFAVLRSDPEASDLNDTSLVLKLTHGQVSFLFTGDAEAASEADLLHTNKEDLTSTILKVGHHGSYTSSSPAFLAAVHPEVAIYSAGRHNSYGHPHAETLAALAAVGAQIYGTDRHGTVIVQSDGQHYQIRTTQPASPDPGLPHTPMPSPISPSLPSTAIPSTGLTAPQHPNGPDANCSDFATRAEAQAFFLAAGGPEADPHRLDGDNDGSACEALP